MRKVTMVIKTRITVNADDNTDVNKAVNGMIDSLAQDFDEILSNHMAEETEPEDASIEDVDILGFEVEDSR